jgi:hypothetical protein
MLLHEMFESSTSIQIDKLQSWIGQLEQLKNQFAPYVNKDQAARQAYYTAKNRIKQAQAKLAKLSQKI